MIPPAGVLLSGSTAAPVTTTTAPTVVRATWKCEPCQVRWISEPFDEASTRCWCCGAPGDPAAALMVPTYAPRRVTDA